jgi:signal transduction histidine kinase
MGASSIRVSSAPRSRGFKARGLNAAGIVTALVCVVLAALGAYASVLAPVEGELPAGAQNAVPAVAFGCMGGLVVSHRRGNRVGWILLGVGLSQAVTLVGSSAAALVPTGWFQTTLAWVGSWSYGPTIVLAVVWLGLLFPDGRLPSYRWKGPAVLAAAASVAWVVALAVRPGPLEGTESLRNPLGLPFPASVKFAELALGVTIGAGALLAVAALVVRWRRNDFIERQRMKWLLYALGFLLALEMAAGASLLPKGQVNEVLITIVLSLLPVAIGIAVLRYGLYEIDGIINRTIVYATVIALVSGLYIGVVAAIGAALDRQLAIGPGIIGAAAVAVAFEPLRRGIGRIVDRLLFGDRNRPLIALRRLGHQLEGATAPSELLTRVASSIAEALRVPYVALDLEPSQGIVQRVAEHGRPTGDEVDLSLVYQSRRVGALLVAPRSPGASFSASDRRLLEELARHASAAAHAAGLRLELAHARERLIRVREEERRRVRHDLHDGLGSLLAGIELGVAGAQGAAPSGETQASLARIGEQIRMAIEEVGRLVDNLGPSALEEQGLARALRAHAEKLRASPRGPVVQVDADDVAVSPEVEVAAYRISLEVMTNAVRHSRGQYCAVTLRGRDGGLEIRVADDGVGIASGAEGGIGMRSMRERARAVGGRCAIGPNPGGGTVVTVWLPAGDP